MLAFQQARQTNNTQPATLSEPPIITNIFFMFTCSKSFPMKTLIDWMKRILIALLAESELRNWTMPQPRDRPFSIFISANFMSPKNHHHPSHMEPLHNINASIDIQNLILYRIFLLFKHQYPTRKTEKLHLMSNCVWRTYWGTSKIIPSTVCFSFLWISITLQPGFFNGPSTAVLAIMIIGVQEGLRVQTPWNSWAYLGDRFPG